MGLYEDLSKSWASTVLIGIGAALAERRCSFPP